MNRKHIYVQKYVLHSLRVTKVFVIHQPNSTNERQLQFYGNFTKGFYCNLTSISIITYQSCIWQQITFLVILKQTFRFDENSNIFLKEKA